MLLFRCRFSTNELAQLKNYLSANEYCLVSGLGEREYYGVMEEGLHDKLLDILSGETLGLLEYVDEAEIREVRNNSITKDVIGNCALLERFE